MKKEEKKWQRWLPWIITAIMGLWVISALRNAREKSEYDLDQFSKIPVLLDGRIQPFDSVARNALLMLRGKASVLITDKPQEELSFFQKARLEKLTATEWLMEAMTRPQEADTRHIFRIDNGEVLGLLKLPADRKYYAFNELKEGWEEVQKQASRIHEAKIEEAAQTPFEKGVVKLSFALNLYFRVKNSLRPENVADFTQELRDFEAIIAPGLAALQQRQVGGEHNEAILAEIVASFQRYQMLGRAAYPFVIPPTDAKKSPEKWLTIGQSLMESLRTGEIHPANFAFAKIADAYGQKNVQAYNTAVTEYKNWLSGTFAPELKKGAQENFFNHYAPFVKSISIYLLAFLFGCAYWINWAGWTRRTSYYLLLMGLAIHTTGLVFRMYLEGRPPVTNLYSSAIFVGWGAVILGIILERIWKDAIGGVTAAAIGVTTLIIAHNLSLGGDTMQMLRAVLDTNFWLATHVVVITLGYSSMFVAGFLATVYILRGFFTTTLTSGTAKALYRMVYGIVCFATLFSFLGTVLGGIWADQSWGRFWGWDPKENGALLIVIWCAVMLHARLGGIIRERGLMAAAVFGNIITAFSWFGVNMLGVGLHSYGFMDKAFKWLMGFNLTQLAVIAIALVPLRYWRSFKLGAQAPAKGKRSPEDPGLADAKPAAA
jgi:ABC-type transport system involved in cytochrome c biogenesis permease subunit